jgi:hypothetical protein
LKKGNPQVSIITVHFNQLPATCEMLESVERCGFKQLEVIVVDNGSTDGAEHVIPARFTGVRYIRSEKNLGFAGGNNLGILDSRGEFLFFLNNDAILVSGALETMLGAFQADDMLGAVSPKICFPPNGQEKPDLVQYAGTTPVHPLTGRNSTVGEKMLDFGQFDQLNTTAYLHGAAMMVRRKVIESVGLMPEEFFLYYEELDWSETIKRAGYRIRLVPRAKIYHHESLTTGSQSPIKTFYLTRNRILFMRRNHNAWQVGLFCLYFGLVALPKNALSFLSKKDLPNLWALWNAVKWHLRRPVLPRTDTSQVQTLEMKKDILNPIQA